MVNFSYGLHKDLKYEVLVVTYDVHADEVIEVVLHYSWMLHFFVWQCL